MEKGKFKMQLKSIKVLDLMEIKRDILYGAKEITPAYIDNFVFDLEFKDIKDENDWGFGRWSVLTKVGRKNILDIFPDDECLEPFVNLFYDSTDKVADFKYLFEVLLSTFSYKHGIEYEINQKLQYFSLVTLYKVPYSYEMGFFNEIKKDLFQKALLFHPCPEWFIDMFSFYGNKFFYRNLEIDMYLAIDNFFSTLYNCKDELEILNPYSIEEMHSIKSLLLDVVDLVVYGSDPA